MESRQERYNELCQRVKADYEKREKQEKNLKGLKMLGCNECEEINLWTY